MTGQIERLLKTYSNARKSWESWCYLANFNLKEPNFKVQREVSRNDLLSHLRYLALKDFYIEAYKILKDSKNNDDNIFKQLRSFNDSNLTKSLEVEKNLEKLMQLKEVIKTLCDLRDKFYAHLDKDYENYMYDGLPLQDILSCFIAIEESIITLTSLETIQMCLDDIPSRNDFSL
ncbi:MAG: hypothetical protein H7Y13_13110 [Sphingobacteriaceae bacterium]|nr:hypothetical protein [Sphingobacteriaceae bacterium]